MEEVNNLRIHSGKQLPMAHTYCSTVSMFKMNQTDKAIKKSTVHS